MENTSRRSLAGKVGGKRGLECLETSSLSLAVRTCGLVGSVIECLTRYCANLFLRGWRVSAGLGHSVSSKSASVMSDSRMRIMHSSR